MSVRIASNQIDLIDLNDAIIAGTQPSNPTEGALWIDTSTNPPVLKVWHASTGWVTQQIDLSYLDPEADGNIQDSKQKLSDMANDLILTMIERLDVKNTITNIIGYIPGDIDTTIPTLASLDSSMKGEVWAIRASAVAAGIPTTDATYQAYGTAYTNLSTYMNGLTPKPWDISTTTNTTLTGTSWRDDWLAYYNSYNTLSQNVTAMLQGNIGGAQFGGRNILSNSTWNLGNKNWESALSSIYSIVSPDTDKPSSSILKITSGSTTSQQSSLPFQITAGQTYTVSFDMKIDTLSSSTAVLFTLRTFTDPSISNSQTNSAWHDTYLTFNNVTVAGQWVRYVHTFTPTAGNYLRVVCYNGSNSTGTNGINSYYREIKVEQGNTATGWTPAPEDLPYYGNGGGRNFLRNTAYFQDITNWSLNVGSNVSATLNDPQNDTTYGAVLNVTINTNSATGNNWIILQNTGLTLPSGKFVSGTIYTLSMMIKNPMTMTVGFKDADGTDAVVSPDYSIPSSATWQQVIWTFTASATGVTPEFYLRVSDTAATGDFYLTQVKLEQGTTSTGWTPAPEDTSTSLISLVGRVTTVEDKVTADAIVLAVTSSSSYQVDLQGKASNSDLDGLASTQYVDTAQSNAQAYADGQIKGLNMTQYVTQSQWGVYQQDITGSFSSAGGINMVQNSIGMSGSDFWTVTQDVGISNGFSTTQTPDLKPYGLKSGFTLDGCKLSQDVDVTPGITYTLSARVFKDTTGTGYLKIYDKNNTLITNTVNFTSGSVYGFDDKQIIDLTPSSSNVTIELYADSSNTTPMIFTGVILNIGAVAFEWSNYPSETYSGNVNLDINGIRVTQTDTNGKAIRYTVVTPSKFAGYADADGNGTIDQTTGSTDEVFRMDADSFVMKAAYIKPIKMIPITSGGYNGIAFVGV